jgi:hypothetical protein
MVDYSDLFLFEHILVKPIFFSLYGLADSFPYLLLFVNLKKHLYIHIFKVYASSLLTTCLFILFWCFLF